MKEDQPSLGNVGALTLFMFLDCVEIYK